MIALEAGAVETVIVWESLELNRYVFRDASGDTHTKNLNNHEEKDRNNFIDPETSVDLDVVSTTPLLEYLANEYKNFGATLEIVTDRSQEGAQFVRGFGGIGGILRYAVNFANFEVEEYDDDDFDLDDY